MIFNSTAAANWSLSLDHEVILPLVSPICQLFFWPFSSHRTLNISVINYDAILLPEETTDILPGTLELIVASIYSTVMSFYRRLRPPLNLVEEIESQPETS